MLPLPAPMTRILRASRQAKSAWRALVAVLFACVGVAVPVGAQLVTPPDTTRIVNTAAYRFVASGGSTVTDSASAAVLLKHIAGVTLVPPRAQAAPAGVRRASS